VIWRSKKRETDLIGASFGRSFYIFDDYSVLRELSEKQMKAEGTLFSVRKAWWYIPRSHLGFGDRPKGTQGHSHFTAPNPPFGATFTYHLSSDLQSKQEMRKAKEKNSDVDFPGWDVVEAERRELDPKILLVVKNSNGNVIRRINAPGKKGFHRVSWDLRYPSPMAVRLGANNNQMPGFMVAPGTFSVAMYKQVDGQTTQLSGSQEFQVVQLYEGALATDSPKQVAKFWRKFENVTRRGSAVQIALDNILNRVESMRTALAQSKADVGDLDKRLYNLRMKLLDLDEALNGNRSKMGPGEKNNPNVGSRLFVVSRVLEFSTYGPTATAKEGLAIAEEQLDTIQEKIEKNQKSLAAMGRELMKSGAPWVEGEALPKNR